MRLKEDMKQAYLQPNSSHLVLLMDEMKIRGGLVFNKHTGKLTGFINIGMIN